MPAAAGVGAGCTVAFSATLPTTFDTNISTGYPSLTFTEAANVTNYVPGGKAWSEALSQPISQDYPNVYKAVYDFGSDSITFDEDSDDAGQVILQANLAVKTDLAVEVTWDDGEVHYYTGKVMSMPVQGVTAAGVVMRTASFRRTSDVVVD